MKLAVGLDIGGSWIRVGLGDHAGRLLRKKVVLVDSTSSEAFVSQIGALISEVAGGQAERVAGIGVGAAGRLNLSEGIIMYSPHTSVRDVPIRNALEERFHLPVCLLNDCVAAVFAEKAIGAGKCHKNIVYVGIGTGIGGGMVVDGNVLLGKEGNAHEIGHMTIDMEGRLECCCGGRGHWEAYTSGSGMPKLARYMARKSCVEGSFIKRIMNKDFQASEIFSAARGGEAFAISVLERTASINSMAFANLVNLYDPSLISVGGGLAIKNPNEVIKPVADTIYKYSFNTPPKFAVTPLGEDAQLLGAILSVFEPTIFEPI